MDKVDRFVRHPFILLNLQENDDLLRWDASQLSQLIDPSGNQTALGGYVNTWQESTRSKGIDAIKLLESHVSSNWGILNQDSLGRYGIQLRGMDSQPSNRYRCLYFLTEIKYRY